MRVSGAARESAPRPHGDRCDSTLDDQRRPLAARPRGGPRRVATLWRSFFAEKLHLLRENPQDRNNGIHA